MRILHYFLGFPPYRTGGLTKYAFDLMCAQVDDGNIVFALWPGKIRAYGGKPVIKRRKNIYGIINCELINPLPVPLDEGIKKIDAYMGHCDESIYERFIKESMVDVIHIHTLMGLHSTFIKAANHLGVRIVFTTHDYFGICPKVTLFRSGTCCEEDHECKDCIQCNCNALSLKKIQIMQSTLYRAMKNTSIIKKLRKYHRGKFYANEVLPNISKKDGEREAQRYEELRAYYINMLENIDIIHFCKFRPDGALIPI